MNSFNVYGQTEQTIGGNTPVWLGTVKPVPVGYVLEMEGTLANFPDGHIPAGTAVELFSEERGVTALKDINGAINTAFGYIYNDVHIGKDANESVQATCAVVSYHPEGLLIERVYPEITGEQIEQLQANIPGVLLVRG
jgi:hypothetical protein